MTPLSALGGVEPNGHRAIIHERNPHLGTEPAAAYGDAMLSDLRLEVLLEALPILGRGRGGKARPVTAGLGRQGKLAHDHG